MKSFVIQYQVVCSVCYFVSILYLTAIPYTVARTLPEEWVFYLMVIFLKIMSFHLYHKPDMSRAKPLKFPSYSMLYHLVLANDIELNLRP